MSLKYADLLAYDRVTRIKFAGVDSNGSEGMSHLQMKSGICS